MALISAGTFSMGSDSGGSWERPVHPVRTSSFEISARPVTNAEFRRFRSQHTSPGNDEDSAPVTGISWDDANAYCAWLSTSLGAQYTLPPEAWWERAVRGGLDRKKYPWGDQPTPDGSERANPYGVYAISYMLWEWTADWYDGSYYERSPAEDPKGPASGVYRVLRGGGYRNDPASATVYARGSARPETKSDRITFRVARALGGAPPTAVTKAAPPPAPPRPATSTAPTRPAPTPTAAAPAKPAPAPPAVARTSPPPATTGPGGPVEVSGVSFAEEGGELIVKIASNGVARFKAFALSGPDRLVVDVLDGTAALRPVTGSVPVGAAGVKSIRYSQFQQSPPIFRIVIDSAAAKKYRIEAWPNELRVRLQP